MTDIVQLPIVVLYDVLQKIKVNSDLPNLEVSLSRESLEILLNKLRQPQIGGRITGAGILILGKEYHPYNKRYEYYTILFKNRKNGVYMEGGGGRGFNENVKVTATRELQEESLNTFKFSPKILIDKDSILLDEYVGFVVNLTGNIDLEFYKYNYKLLNNRRAPHDWKETNGIIKIFLSDLVQGGIMTSRGIFKMGQITLFDRTKKFIRFVIEKNIIGKKQHPTVIQNFVSKSTTFLNGTKCYLLD